jgi:hypothetical protein
MQKPILASILIIIWVIFIIITTPPKAVYKFIHIPKNAGTSICKSAHESKLNICCTKNESDWSCAQGAHIPIIDLLSYNPKHTIYFASIRNPYDRFISAFSHSRYPTPRYMKEIQQERKYYDMSKFTDVNDFIKQIKNKNKNALKAFNDLKFHTQTKYLCVKDTNIIHKSIKYLLKQEQLEHDLKVLCKNTGICIQLTKDKYKANVNSYPKVPLTNESIQFINQHYKKDFDLLHYKMKII